MAGVLITLEGGEGSGKSTQAATLYKRLLLDGYTALLVHEPGGTPIGEEIRVLLIAERGNFRKSKEDKRRRRIDPVAELLLFSAARAELVSNVLDPALAAGQIIISDRYVNSTIAYQGYARGLPLETVVQVNKIATGGLEPELVILLDVEPEDALRRVSPQISLWADSGLGPANLRQDEEGRRRFEREPLQFHRKVRSGYLNLAKADPDRWLVVDGALAQEQVAEMIWRRVEPLVKGLGSTSR